MKRIGTVLLACIVLLTILPLACTQTNTQTTPTRTEILKVRTVVEKKQDPNASPLTSITWVPMTTADLVEQSTVVAEGEVTNVGPIVQFKIPKIVVGDQAAKTKTEHGENDFVVVKDSTDPTAIRNSLDQMSYRLVTVKVDKHFKDRTKTSSVIIAQMEGIGKEQGELFLGQKVILFLQNFLDMKFIDASQQIFQITGGPQGTYIVDENANAVHVSDKTNTTVGDIEEEIKK